MAKPHAEIDPFPTQFSNSAIGEFVAQRARSPLASLSYRPISKFTIAQYTAHSCKPVHRVDHIQDFVRRSE